jgi:hypothetical protein
VKTINRGVAVSRAQAVSQKTRKQSASKNTKKSAAASRGASKGRAKAPVKGAKKAAAAKSSNKRSAMPPKNAKTVAKAAGSKSSASKAPAKTAAKAPVAKPAAAVKPVAAAAPKAAVKPAVPPRVEEKKPLTQRQSQPLSRRKFRRVRGLLDDVKGLEVLPESVRWIGQPSMRECVGLKQIAVFIVIVRLGHLAQQGGHYRTQERDRACKDDCQRATISTDARDQQV